jgi:hypothetical protein
MAPGDRPFSADAGRRLCRLLNVSHEQLWDHFEAVNVYDSHVPHAEWRARHARSEYERRVLPLERGYQVVLLCGWHVAAAAACHSGRYFEHSERRYVSRYVFPHPSGKNRWYNESENRLAAAEFLRRVLQMT